MPSHLWLNKFSRWFWCMLKFEDHCFMLHCLMLKKQNKQKTTLGSSIRKWPHVKKKTKTKLLAQVSENDRWACWVSYNLMIMEFARFLWRKNTLLRKTWGKPKTSKFPEFLSHGGVILMILAIKEGKWHGENWLSLKWESIFYVLWQVLYGSRNSIYVFISLMKCTEVKSNSFLTLSICDSLFPFKGLEQYIC